MGHKCDTATVSHRNSIHGTILANRNDNGGCDECQGRHSKGAFFQGLYQRTCCEIFLNDEVVHGKLSLLLMDRSKWFLIYFFFVKAKRKILRCLEKSDILKKSMFPVTAWMDFDALFITVVSITSYTTTQ